LDEKIIEGSIAGAAWVGHGGLQIVAGETPKDLYTQVEPVPIVELPHLMQPPP
jgi:hypothetical protein